MLMKGGVKPITELLKAVKELFADSKGKWSSKRTISGVIVLAASSGSSSAIAIDAAIIPPLQTWFQLLEFLVINSASHSESIW